MSASTLAESGIGTLAVRTYEGFGTQSTDQFCERFLRRHGEDVQAVIFYGSRISAATASPTSIHDFFLLTGDYFRFHRSAIDAMVNCLLPPNIYRIAVPGSEPGQVLRAKYNVVSMTSLRRHVGPKARDLYLLGRFSKRMGICYLRDEGVRRSLEAIFERAFSRVFELALPLAGEWFDVDRLCLTMLGLSYRGDERIEAADKVSRIFDASADYYREIADRLISRAAGVIPVDGGYRLRWPPAAIERAAAQTESVIRRSRLLAKCRWPKYLWTYDDWVDYVLDKIERSKGLRIELSDRERRFAVFHALKYFLRFRRQGLLS